MLLDSDFLHMHKYTKAPRRLPSEGAKILRRSVRVLAARWNLAERRGEPVELLGRGPPADQVRVGDEHAGSVRVGRKNADRPAGLDEQGLIVCEREEGRVDEAVGEPVAGGPGQGR
jgi:hypothetical protein